MKKVGLYFVLAAMLLFAGCGKTAKEKEASEATKKAAQQVEENSDVSLDTEAVEEDFQKDNTKEETEDNSSSGGSLLDKAKQAGNEATAQVVRTWITVAIAEAQVKKWECPEGSIRFRWPETPEGLKDVKELGGEYAVLRECMTELFSETVPELSVTDAYLMVEISGSNVTVEVSYEE